MKATIYKSTGSWYTVQAQNGSSWKARIKGVFKTDDISSTNPIAVGDFVEIEIENEAENTATITHIHDRLNYVARQSPHTRHRHHIVASNLDQSMLIATLKDPRTSLGFVDRFLIACEAYHVPAVILLNKKDTWRKKEQEQFALWKAIYEPIGYTIEATSIHLQEGLDTVKQLLKGKTTLLSGHSGVGKSSLLNVLFPAMNLRTGEVSNWSGKGLHTTTFAEMHNLDFGGRVIDTPGVREFGLVDIDREELAQYFPEMRGMMHQCQFNNCQHLNEPGCAVKAAVQQGTVSAERYASYLTIRDSIRENDWD
ncbi:MAG: ribosome small subunit-dependent GTPase A [Chitinophagaceae bacterium]|nr:ribosome small subunit-dependent GTPase A [Chitinophagaceae bacterium]